MANETKNRQHAIGTFVGAEPVAAPFTSRIVNAVGVESFTRNSPGNYTAVLRDAIAFAGATVRADLPANFLGIAGAQLAPDGSSVLVTVFDLSGAPADAPLVALEVVSVVQGEGDDGPKPALPGPPTPGGGGSLLGWADINGTNGATFAQSTSAPLASSLRNSVGDYTYTLKPGLNMRVAQVQNTEQPKQAFGSAKANNVTQTVNAVFFTDAGVLIDTDHYAFFYTL